MRIKEILFTILISPWDKIHIRRQFIVYTLNFMIVGHGLTFTSNANEVYSIMQDLQGVEVFVKDIDNNLSSLKLSESQLHAGVVQRLKNAGVQILTGDDASGIPGLPILYISVKTAKHPANIYAYYIDVSLREVVRLERNDLLFIDAPSWSVQELGILDINGINKLHDRIHHNVDKFIIAYQLANPHLLALEDRIREVQRRLKEAGFAPGPIDGQFGPMTKHALYQFQRVHNIPTTGNMDKATLKALGIQVVTSPSPDK